MSPFHTNIFNMPTIATVVLLGLAVQFDGCKANETPSGDAVGQADFAVDLLKAVYRNRAESEPAKNTVLSPLSAAIALAMAYAGARGQTAAEFGKVLAGEYKLRIANRVYLANTFKVLEQFKSVINAHYGGNFESIDFAQNVAAAKKINAFVENSTNGKIKDLIKSRDLNSLTKFVLVNAIYFKANWLQPFSDRMTEKLTFFMTNGQEIKLDMMQTQDTFICIEQDKFKMLGMPYVGEKAHLLILLPNANDGLENLLNELKGAKLMELAQNSAITEVKVILPKFKIESSHQLEEVLPSLGIKSAFEPNNADFSGISNTQLYINEVIQKAMISINENGTEAAAATAVLGGFKSFPPPPTSTFRANHPFAFFLIDSQKHVMFSGVFMGEQ